MAFDNPLGWTLQLGISHFTHWFLYKEWNVVQGCKFKDRCWCGLCCELSHTPDNDVLIPRCVPPGGGHLLNHLSSPPGGLFIITFQVRKLGPCRDVSTARLLTSQRRCWLSLFYDSQPFPAFCNSLLCTVLSVGHLPYCVFLVLTLT